MTASCAGSEETKKIKKLHASLLYYILKGTYMSLK
jgi:hypothetical protein